MHKDLQPVSLKHRTVRGVRFTVLTTVSGMLLQTGILVVLARLLRPNDYGTLAAAMIFTTPLQTTLLSATERAIVLQADMSDAALSSALFALLAATAGFAGIIAVAGLSIWFHGGGQFGLVLALLSPSLMLTGASMPARAHLRYQMGFGKIGLCDLSAQLIGTGVVGIFCALRGFGPYSLVFAALTLQMIQIILYWTLSGTRIVPRLDIAYIHKLAVLSFQVVRISVLDTIQSQLLFVFTWFYSGHIALGILNRAYYIIQLPTQLLVNALVNVLFVGFTLVKNEREKLISAMRSLVEISSVVTFPFTAGMAASAPELVHVMLGPKWVGAAPLIQWLAIGTACVMTGHLFAVMAEAVGRLREKYLVQVLATVAALLVYFWLARFGLLGSGRAFALSWFVYLIGQLVLGAYILKVRFTQFALWLLPGLASSLAIVICVLGLRAEFGTFPAVLLLALEVFGCGLTLLVVLRVGFHALLLDLLRFTGLGFVSRLLFLTAASGRTSL